MSTPDLFDHLAAPADIPIDPGALLLPGFALAHAPALLAAIDAIATAAPFRHMVTPGGFAMSVATTSCGALGWITDRRGYRYASADPDTTNICIPIGRPLAMMVLRTSPRASLPSVKLMNPGATASTLAHGTARRAISARTLSARPEAMSSGLRRSTPASRIATAVE